MLCSTWLSRTKSSTILPLLEVLLRRSKLYLQRHLDPLLLLSPNHSDHHKRWHSSDIARVLGHLELKMVTELDEERLHLQHPGYQC